MKAMDIKVAAMLYYYYVSKYEICFNFATGNILQSPDVGTMTNIGQLKWVTNMSILLYLCRQY